MKSVYAGTRDSSMEDEEDNRTAVLETAETSSEPVQKKTLDKLIEALGSCGRFQVIFVFLGYSPLLLGAWILTFMFFASYNPGWTCQDTLQVNNTDLFQPSGIRPFPATQDGNSLSGNKTIVSSCDAMRLCENVTFNDGVSTIVTEWALVCDNGWVFPIIFTVHMSGVILGSAIAGYVGDNLGRKFNIHGSAALLTITHIIAVFSGSWQMYAVMRFIIGVGCGGILSTNLIYVSEFVPKRWRGYLGAFPSWTLGTFTLSLCVTALKNWKHIHIATAIFAFLVFVPVFWLPESLRFLAVHGKLKRGHKVVQKIARLNRRPVPDTSIMANVAETERENMKTQSRYTYLDLFHKSVRKSSIVLGMAWFIISAASYLIGFGLKALSGDYFVNFLLFTSIAFPSRLLSVVLTTKCGRKFTCIMFVLCSAVCSFIFVALHLFVSKETRDIPSVVLAFGSFLMLQAAWGVVAVWGVELFPTGVRNLSYSYVGIMARIGAMIVPYIIRKETFPIFGSFIILGVLQIILVVGFLTIQETKDLPLPDNFVKKSEKESSSVETDQL